MPINSIKSRRNANSESRPNLSLQIGPIYEEQLGLYALQSPRGTVKNPIVSLSDSYRSLLGKCTIHFFLTRANSLDEEEDDSDKDSDWELPLGSQNINKLMMPMKFKLPGMKDIKESKESGYRIKVQVKNEKGNTLSESHSNSFKVLSRYEYLSHEAQVLRDSRHRKKSPQQEFDEIKKQFENFLTRNPDLSYINQLQQMLETIKSGEKSESKAQSSSASVVIQENHTKSNVHSPNSNASAEQGHQVFTFLDGSFPMIQPASNLRKRSNSKEKKNDTKRVKAELPSTYDNLPNTNHLSSILSAYGLFSSESATGFGFPSISSTPAFDLTEVNQLEDFGNFEDSSSEGIQSSDSENDMDTVLPYLGISADINAFLDHLKETYAT
eukprot:TRINITY_DN5471_c0_g1_i1.p1 TRINITY_DN5471_c0_g1~~TRINITY_DN5471_c0_g1_i1.p1  ORF type:complete len:383 (-),score=147.36 TRINITY_DN5471_c0_g1_i1:181-1329(-)